MTCFPLRAIFKRQANVRVLMAEVTDFDREANVIIAFFNGLETSWLLDKTVPIVDMARGFLDELIARIRKP